MTVVGTRIGHFQITDVLGKGGMGEVYVAFDETLERKVALKAIRAEHRLDAASKARFLREARILSSLEHPNICRIYDYIEEGRNDFLVLELIKGRNLRHAAKTLSRSERIHIAEQIVQVLTAAHEAGVVHRDLKPENVMLTPDGVVKVLDFGLALSTEAAPPEPPADDGFDAGSPVLPAEGESALAVTAAGPTRFGTARGQIMGTLEYMSPEQARGEPATSASDMYSLGLVLQDLFTGSRPYGTGLSTMALLEQAGKGITVPVAGLDADLTGLIERLKTLAPASRPTAVETAARLRWIRDKPRRRWRNLTLAAAALVVVSAAAKYTVDLNRERKIAVEARQEADRRRAQAEDLISFMLGDLREKLEPVGRLEVLDGVGDKALEYFASLEESDLTDEELFRRSKALSQIGEVRIAQGNLDAAMATLDEALQLAQGLARRDAENGPWQVGLGAIHFWRGNVHWMQDDLAAAQREFQAYLDVANHLVALDPANLDWQLELGYAHTNLGAVHEAMGETTAAIEAIRRSNEIKERLVQADPSNVERRTGLANGLGWLASSLEDSGRLQEALEHSRSELAARRELSAQDPQDAEALQLLSNSQGHVGDLLLATGDLVGALPLYEEALEISTALAAQDPDNTDWKRDLAVSHHGMAKALLARAEGGRAVREIEAGEAVLEELTRRDASNVDWQRELAKLRSTKASASLSLRRFDRALEQSSRAVAMLNVVTAENPEDREAHRALSHAYLMHGCVLSAAEREKDARRAWTAALEAIQPFTETSAIEILDPWARSLLLLGRTEQAQPLLETLSHSGYARWDFRQVCPLGRPGGDMFQGGM